MFERSNPDASANQRPKGKTRFLLQWGLIQVLCVCVGVFVIGCLSLHRALGINGWLVTLLLAAIASYCTGIWLWNRTQVKSRDYAA